MNKFIPIVFLFLGLICASFSGCDDTDEPQVIPGDTILNIRLTDFPTNLEEVNVDIKSIIIKSKSSGKDSIFLATKAGIYNLLNYQNGLDTLIASNAVDIDSIYQIRLVLGERNTVKVDSEVFPLETPSSQQSGLKINTKISLKGSEVYNLLLDFDAKESILITGGNSNNNRYILKPVIKVK